MVPFTLIRDALKPVEDPELHIGVLDLGLIYEVAVGPDVIERPEPSAEGKTQAAEGSAPAAVEAPPKKTEGDGVNIKMTLTSPACPYGPMMMASVHGALAKIPGVADVNVDLVFKPVWDPKTMANDDAKDQLGDFLGEVLKISSSAEYAMRILVFLAKNEARAPFTAEVISKSENVPRDFVNQLLLRLRQAGLVDSKRGSNGGHRLARVASRISVGDVFRAVGHPLFEDSCDRYKSGDQQCLHQGNCGIQGVWSKLSGMVESYLNAVPLSDLLAETETSPFAKIP